VHKAAEFHAGIQRMRAMTRMPAATKPGAGIFYLGALFLPKFTQRFRGRGKKLYCMRRLRAFFDKLCYNSHFRFLVSPIAEVRVCPAV
jgi:hypothetical protein